MTTSPVTTLTDELIAELEEAAENATGGDWEYHMGIIRTDADSEGYVPIAVAPNTPRNWRKQRDMNMQHIAIASPATIAALVAELRLLRAENAELAQSLAESRANDQAAMGWLTSLRLASGDRGERMLPELVTHVEELKRDAEWYYELAMRANANCRNCVYFFGRHRPELAAMIYGFCSSIEADMNQKEEPSRRHGAPFAQFIDTAMSTTK